MKPFEESKLKKIINALDNLPLVSGIPEDICELLRQAGSTVAIHLANEYLGNNNEK